MRFQPGFGTQDDTYVDFKVGAVNISLFDQHEMSEAVHTAHLPSRAEAQDKVAWFFAVEDVEAVCRKVKSKGIRLEVESVDHADWGVRTAHFRGPDGNLIEINQPLPH